jgi:putative acetyltransferase
LIDIGNGQSALRKMFVKKGFRGAPQYIAQRLLETLFDWCATTGISEIYLGTRNTLAAAQRFYLKNGFVETQKQDLPPNFPLMAVDNCFFAFKSGSI